jgi:hypothetical protein
MTYNEKDDYHKCSQCGCEVWQEDTYKPTDEIGELMADMAPTHRQTEVLPAGPWKLGGGSKNGGVKKPKSTKSSLSQLNEQLYR